MGIYFRETGTVVCFCFVIDGHTRKNYQMNDPVQSNNYWLRYTDFQHNIWIAYYLKIYCFFYIFLTEPTRSFSRFWFRSCIVTCLRSATFSSATFEYPATKSLICQRFWGNRNDVCWHGGNPARKQLRKGIPRTTGAHAQCLLTS